MNLSTIEPTLLEIAAIVTGLPATCCVFENAPRPTAGALALLSWVSRAAVGIDTVQWSFAENSDPLQEMTPTVSGARVASLQLSVEVLSDQRAGHNAASIIERARTRFAWPSVTDRLHAAGLALATIGPARQADYTADRRLVSRSLFEVRLNASAIDADTAGRTSYIAAVRATGSVSSATGDPLPDSLQPTTGDS